MPASDVSYTFIPYTFDRYLGVSLRVGLSRSIFPGAGRSTVSIIPAIRAQKGYLRISRARFASCIAPTSPAIISAPLVRSACAPEVLPKLAITVYKSKYYSFLGKTYCRILLQKDGNLCKHIYLVGSPANSIIPI